MKSILLVTIVILLAKTGVAIPPDQCSRGVLAFLCSPLAAQTNNDTLGWEIVKVHAIPFVITYSGMSNHPSISLPSRRSPAPKVGEKVGGYEVIAITSTNMTIRRDDKTITLMRGGTLAFNEYEVVLANVTNGQKYVAYSDKAFSLGTRKMTITRVDCLESACVVKDVNSGVTYQIKTTPKPTGTQQEAHPPVTGIDITNDDAEGKTPKLKDLGKPSENRYVFRAVTQRDILFAKAATDWLFHDEWGRIPPSNAYAKEWFNQIPGIRSNLMNRTQPIPVDIISGTNTYSLLTYQATSRVFHDRPSTPDPWPTPRLTIRYWTNPQGLGGFWLSWDDWVKFDLSIHEVDGKVTIQGIKNLIFI